MVPHGMSKGVEENMQANIYDLKQVAMKSFFFFFCFSWSEYFVEKRIIECIEGVDH